ncbi:MAG TPA: tetratricopeptide repeat protein [Longimicrobium sp.]|nr:tetratricopeptide repeat protein [Longimicrobium sp.]
MKANRGLLLTMGAAALTAACTPPAAPGGGPAPGGGMRVTVGLPDVTCATGRFAQHAVADSSAAAMALVMARPEAQRQAEWQNARDQAMRATQADPENAYGYYLLGQANVQLGDLAAADAAWDRAVAICPELAAAELNAARAQASAEAAARAFALYQAQDTAGALRVWEQAGQFDPTNPNPAFNAATVFYQREQTQQAVENYRRALEVLNSPPATLTEEQQADWKNMRASVYNGLLGASIQYLTNDQDQQATTLLAELSRLAPNHPDVWYHHALALYNLERWQELTQVAQKATELDPLNYDAWILYYNGYAGQAQAADDARNTAQAEALSRQATAIRERSQRLPVRLRNVQYDAQDSTTRIFGAAVGTGVGTGPITIEFTVFGESGPVGTQTLTLTPPAKDQAQAFEVNVPTTGPVMGYTYRVR